MFPIWRHERNGVTARLRGCCLRWSLFADLFLWDFMFYRRSTSHEVGMVRVRTVYCPDRPALKLLVAATSAYGTPAAPVPAGVAAASLRAPTLNLARGWSGASCNVIVR